MAFVPASNVLQIEARGTYHGNPFENVIYFKRDTAWDATAWTNLVPTILAWVDLVRAQQSNSVLWSELYATDLTSQSAQTFSFPISPQRAGALTNPGLPANVAFCVSFKTAARGRSFRGRNYVVGLTEADVVGNIVDTDVAQALRDAYDSLRLASGTTTFWVVLSRQANGVARSAGLATRITSVNITDQKVDTQRRRLS